MYDLTSDKIKTNYSIHIFSLLPLSLSLSLSLFPRTIAGHRVYDGLFKLLKLVFEPTFLGTTLSDFTGKFCRLTPEHHSLTLMFSGGFGGTELALKDLARLDISNISTAILANPTVIQSVDECIGS